MRRTKYARITLVLLTVALLATPSLALAEEGVPQSSTNLLTNPSFESGAAVSVGTVAGGWSPWWLTGSESQQAAGYGIAPTYELATTATAPNGVRDGNASQSWKHTFGTTAAGVYQTVTVPKNATIRFEVYGRGYSCDTPSVGGCPATSSSPSSLNLQIGLNPLGGTEFFSASTIRSSERNAYDAFQRFVLDVGTGGSDKVTVFLKYQPGVPAEINQVWWDQASLTVISGGQPAEPTTTPTATPDDTTDTPLPEGSYEVKGGDTLGNIARSHNVTLTDLINLNLDKYPSMASNPDVIYAGWILKLPAVATTDTTTTTTTTTTDDTTTTTVTPTPAPVSIPGETYVVQGGDTLLKIARETGVAVPELIALNETVYPSLRSQPDVIYVGWVLKLK